MDFRLPITKPANRLLPWALAGLCAAAYVAGSWLTAAVPALRPDTASYLYFDPSRPIGYPLFLWIVEQFGELQLAVRAQMLLMAGSLFLLGWAFYKWTGSAVLSALFQIALLASPEMWKFSAMLITEALATAGVALWCAQLLMTARRPSIGGIGSLALISVASALVKPSLVMMFFATAVAAFLLDARKDRFSALAFVAALLVAALGATPIANYFLHGSTITGSPVARGILQHTLFCSAPEQPADRDAAFVEQQARPVREYIDSAPQGTQDMLKRMYTGRLRFGLMIPTLGRMHGLDASWQADALVWKIARERLWADPACYADSVIETYFDLVTYKSYSRADTERLSQWLAANPPLEIPVVPLLPGDEKQAMSAAREFGVQDPLLAGREEYDAPFGRPLSLIWAARLVYASTAVLGILAVFASLRGSKWRPELRKFLVCAAAMGILFHGVLAITSLIELHLTRYTVPVWPVVCTLLGMIACLVLNRTRAVSAPRPAPAS